MPPELKAIQETVQRAVAAVVEEEAAPPEYSSTAGNEPAVVEEDTTKQPSTKPSHSTVAEPEGAKAPQSPEADTDHLASHILSPEQQRLLIEHLEDEKRTQPNHPRWRSKTAIANHAIWFLADALKVKVLTETGASKLISEKQFRSILRLLEKQGLSENDSFLEKLMRRSG